MATGNASKRFSGFRLRLVVISVSGWLTLVFSTLAQGPYAATIPSNRSLPTNTESPLNSGAAAKMDQPAANSEPPSISATPPSDPLQPPGAKPLECGQIVARVDGQVILSCDVLWQVNLILDRNRKKIPPSEIENARNLLMHQQVLGLIDTKLLFADFRRTVPVDNLPKIEENLEKPFEEHEIPRLIKMLEVKDRRELADLLKKYESSLSDVKRLFIERTIAGEWLRQRMPKTKPVTHEQMLEYYQQHLQDYKYPAQVQWEELMVRLDRFGGDRSKAWQAIAEMGNDVWWQASKDSNAHGAMFEKIAKSRSQGFSAQKGGWHDWTTIDSLRCQAINNALFSLQVGQLSNIIESERGFHIVRVLQRKTAGQTPFTEAQAAIRKKLEEQQRKVLVAKEIAKLRKNSRVWTIYDGHLGAEKLSQVLRNRQSR